jgi:pantetheine-phosphate adenylyltransferase
MTTALFAGTFDPPTLGHLNLIKRSGGLCNKLFVAIAENSSKPNPLFTIAERRTLLETICKPYPHVQIVSFSSLTTDFAKENNVDFLIRGLRSAADFEAEARMAAANRKLSGIETLFLIAEEQTALISSTLIREIGKFGRRLHGYVPPEIENEVFERLSRS